MILVTGGTGLVGSHLLRALVAHSSQTSARNKEQKKTTIRAIRRKSSKLNLVADIAEQIEWVEADILEVENLRQAMQGVTHIYHCAAIIAFDKAQFELMHRVNMEGTANVVNLALQEGVQKLVHVSSIAALGRNDRSNQIDENTKWEESPHNSQYAISKYRAEMEVWRGIAEGLNAVIVNPAVIIGEGNWTAGSSQLISQVVKGLPFYPIGGTGFVDVKDVTDAMIVLMQSNISSERFILNGINTTYQDFFHQVAAAFQKKAPRFKITPLIAALSWRLAKPLSWITRKPPLITKETAQLMQSRYFYDNSKLQKMVEYTYRTLEETLQRIAQNYPN